MLCLDVLRNGKKIARAGVKRGSVSATVNWWGHSEPIDVGGLPERGLVPGLSLWVSGVESRTHLDWAHLRRVRLGDEMTIRIVRGRSDPPGRKKAFPKARHTKTGSLTKCCFCRRWRGDREVDAPSMAENGLATICYQCVFLAAALVESHAARALHLRMARMKRCSFCGKPRARLVTAHDTSLCVGCLTRFRRHF
jgi:hypothetical protein